MKKGYAERRSYYVGYYKANKTLIDAKRRAYRAANKEAVGIKVREYVAAKKKLLTEEQREAGRARCRAYYAANKARLNKNHREYQKRNPSRIIRLNRAAVIRKYGLTPAAYEQLVKDQNHCCKICGRDDWACRGGYLAVDHCHKTGAVRGLLCTQCNAGIGALQEIPELLEKAAAYVRSFQCS